MIWIFRESGSVPGVPGTFANCLVDIAPDGSIAVQPLVQYPHVDPASEAPTADDTASETEAPAPENIEEA